jgi:hypothetical protein
MKGQGGVQVYLPYSFNLGSRYRWVANVTLRLPYPPANSTQALSKCSLLSKLTSLVV